MTYPHDMDEEEFRTSFLVLVLFSMSDVPGGMFTLTTRIQPEISLIQHLLYNFDICSHRSVPTRLLSDQHKVTKPPSQKVHQI